MTVEVSQPGTESVLAGSLPRRDFVLLPLISLATILLLIVVAESVTRLIWPEQEEDRCEFYDSLGLRHRPFCSTTMKNVEGPWVRYQYNACGYRGTVPCGPKPPSTSRFVTLGTSIAFGLYVPDEDLFETRAAPQLKQILGHPVEFQNLGEIGPDFRFQYKFVDEVAGLHPDGVFFVVVPFDLKRLDDNPSPNVGGRKAAAPEPKHLLPNLSDIAYLGRSSRAFFLAQHFMLLDEEFAVRAFLMKGDPDDVAHVPESPLAQQRLQRLGTLISQLSEGLKSHGIPLYVVPLPSRLQAALIGRHTSMPGVDAHAFVHDVATMARNSGAKFIDVTPELDHIKQPERLFYAVDGHLNGAGNKAIADGIVHYFGQQSP